MHRSFAIQKIINREGIRLGTFALLVVVLLTITHSLTKSRIAANQIVQQQRLLMEVLGDHWANTDVDDEPLRVLDEINNVYREYYLITRDQQPVAVIIDATATDGYSGNIDLLVGITDEGTITGVRVTSHTETPGLGDAIERHKSLWITGFNGKNLQTPAESNWTVKKHGGEFDQFTGATITPKAVVNEVKNTLQFFHRVKSELLHHE